MHVLIVGAAGGTGRVLARKIAQGEMLGPQQSVSLHMLDIPPKAEALNVLKMQLDDVAFPLLEGVAATTDVAEASKGIDIAVMVVKGLGKVGNGIDAVNEIAEMAMYRSLASALKKNAAADYKVLVAEGSAVTTALFLRALLPETPPQNLTCLSGSFDGWATEDAGNQSDAEFVADSVCYNIRCWLRGTPKPVEMGVHSDGSYNVPAACFYPMPVTCEDGKWNIAGEYVPEEYLEEMFSKATHKVLDSLPADGALDSSS